MRIELEKIRDQVVKGEIGKALDLLGQGMQNSKFDIEIALLQARYNKMNNEVNRNVINEDTAQLEFSKITLAILELLHKIRDDFFTSDMIYDPLLLFETPREMFVPKQTREYATVFEKVKARHIAWELNMKYPKILANFNFSVNWIILKDGNPITSKLYRDFSLEKDWTNSWHSDSYGFEDPGNWETGNYTIEVYIDEKMVARGSFKIQ